MKGSKQSRWIVVAVVTGMMLGMVTRVTGMVTKMVTGMVMGMMSWIHNGDGDRNGDMHGDKNDVKTGDMGRWQGALTRMMKGTMAGMETPGDDKDTNSMMTGIMTDFPVNASGHFLS